MTANIVATCGIKSCATTSFGRFGFAEARNAPKSLWSPSRAALAFAILAVSPAAYARVAPSSAWTGPVDASGVGGSEPPGDLVAVGGVKVAQRAVARELQEQAVDGVEHLLVRGDDQLRMAEYVSACLCLHALAFDAGVAECEHGNRRDQQRCHHQQSLPDPDCRQPHGWLLSANRCSRYIIRGAAIRNG